MWCVWMSLQGFCHVSSVDPGTVADRAGLRTVYQAAFAAGKLLVISRLAGEKITPWLVATSGSIRCFDTISISKKLSLHRQTGQPVRLHVMVWDGALTPNHYAEDSLGRENGMPSAGYATASRDSYSGSAQQSPHYKTSTGYVKAPLGILAGFDGIRNGHVGPSPSMESPYSQYKYAN